MELLLNLAWLLLAVPAYWLWRDGRATDSRVRFSSRQCLLALGCALVVLFPVVSATDDLHALCAAVEESPISKRTVRQASSEKAASAQSHQALASIAAFAPAHAECWYQSPSVSYVLPFAPVVHEFGRAPPASPLA
ncbi:MAG TPA: hypothetical protein VGS78_05190 [Candidatus Sulfotelmatobacter sp.]|nr:hypothetical protein [Candidatus Sulfotelmatobacter sp.]